MPPSRPLRAIVATVVVLAVAAGLAAIPAPAEAQQNLLAIEQAQLRQLLSTRDELAIAAERDTQNNLALAARLDGFNPTDTGNAPATLDTLRRAQLEVNLARTRLETIERRIDVATNSVAALDDRIARLGVQAQGSEAGSVTLADLVDEAQRNLLLQQRSALTETLGALSRYRSVATEHLALVREALALERARIELSDVIALDAILVDPLISRLRLRVADLNQENIALSNSAADTQTDTADGIRQRNLLQLRADAALLAGNARLLDIDLLVARHSLDALHAIVREPAVPIALLEEALAAVLEVRSSLADTRAERRRNETALSDLLRIAEDYATGDATADADRARLLRRLDQLRVLFADQTAEIAALSETIEPLRSAFSEEISSRTANALVEREVARVDSVARGRLADEAAELPAKILAVLETSAQTVRARVENAPSWQNALAIAAGLAILIVAVLLRRRALPWLVDRNATRLTLLPLKVMRDKLYWLVPAGIFTATGAIVAFPRDVFEIGLAVLLVPAVAALVRGILEETIISRSTGRRREIGRTILVLTTASVIVIAIVVIVYTLLNDTFVLPSTRSWINRLVFATFLLASIPLFLFAAFFLAHTREDTGTTPAQAGLAFLSLLPPAVLVAIGASGLLGYTRLAAEIFTDVATLAAILLTLAFSMALLHDLLDGAIARIRTNDPARAYFVRSNFARPLNRAGQIILVVVAAITIWSLFDLSTETPVIREVIAVLAQPLFTIGGTVYRIGSVIAAVVALFAVFWIGGWSQRVSYTVVYRNVRDLGIRQSLSVFTKYVVIVVGLLMTLSIIGFDITTLTVFAASLGVGIGFGLQNLVNNFISGVLILIERPLRIGDIVTVTGNTGTVDAIGIRSLRLKTFDEYDVIVPNSAVISDTFVNWSRTDKVIRQLLTIGIAYDDEPNKAVAIVREIIDSFSPILTRPAPSVTVDEFADSSVNLRVAYYVELGGAVGVFDIRNHVLTEVWRAFREAGITIPFPQRDVHMIAPPIAEREGLPVPKDPLSRALRSADATAASRAGPLEPGDAPLHKRDEPPHAALDDIDDASSEGPR